MPRFTGGGNAAALLVEQPGLNVAVVPAADSAGFFVALHEGLFAARGLHVTFIPAVSSETVINAQALDEPREGIDISCGNYVSYIQAQENYDQGKRPSSASSIMVAADLDIFAEGSVMQPNAQGLYVMPNSPVRTLADLEGKTIGVNAPGNILYLLAASVLAEHGLKVSGARFAYYPLPEMAAMLRTGKIAAAVLPEPFASQAELSMGVTLLADLDQGATAAFPVQGCAVTRQWAAPHPGDAGGVPRRVRALRLGRNRAPGCPVPANPSYRHRFQVPSADRCLSLQLAPFCATSTGPLVGPITEERRWTVARPGKRRRNGGRRTAVDGWERWQLLASIARIVIEVAQPLLDHFFGGGGPGHLPY